MTSAMRIAETAKAPACLVDTAASACYSCIMTTHNKCDDTDCNGQYCYGFNCWDCNFNTLHGDEYYMVDDELWKTATIFGHDPVDTCVMLCIGCLEARIGGKLTAGDFPEIPINQGYFPRSARFMDRLAN